MRLFFLSAILAMAPLCNGQMVRIPGPGGKVAAGGGGATLISMASGLASSPDGSTTSATPINTTGATLLVMSIVVFSDICGVAPTSIFSQHAGTNNWHCAAEFSTGSVRHSLWYAYDSGSSAPLITGSGDYFSVSFVGAYSALAVAAFGNTLTGADPLRSITGSATNVTGSITPTSTDLVISGMGDASGSGPYTVNSPLTTGAIEAGTGNNWAAAIGYFLSSTGSALNQTWSGGSTTATTLAAFKQH